MSQDRRCPQCGADKVRWKTELRSIYTDVQTCTRCGHELAAEDWHAPITPLGIGRCINCGDRMQGDRCFGCDLSHDEAVQVHHELAAMLGEGELFRAARVASRQGRRVLALKLATAAASLSPESRDHARALRVWIVASLGETAAALEDARKWVEDTPDPAAIAFAALGQQLEANDNPGAAADAYGRSLGKDEDQPLVRGRRAKLLVLLRREGQAVADVIRLFESPKLDDTATKEGIEAAEMLVEKLHAHGEDGEIKRMLAGVGKKRVETSATLLGYQALVCALDGDESGAKSSLRKAKRIEKNLPVYALVDAEIKPAKSGWWRW